MTPEKFIELIEKEKKGEKSLETIRLNLTRFVVENVGLLVTNQKETPNEFLTEEQLKIKQMVNQFGYKVRLPHLQAFFVKCSKWLNQKSSEAFL